MSEKDPSSSSFVADTDVLSPNISRRPKSHFRADGKPKVGYKLKMEAQITAGRLTSEMGIYFEEYSCGCKNYHIGNSKYTTRRDLARTFEEEVPLLGLRVVWNQWLENNKTPDRREEIIQQRFRRLGREAIPSRPPLLVDPED